MNKSWHPQTYMNMVSLIAKGYINDFLNILNIGLYFFPFGFFRYQSDTLHYVFISCDEN